MNALSRWLVTTILLILALICYAIGSAVGIGIVVFLGVIFELLFWHRILHKTEAD